MCDVQIFCCGSTFTHDRSEHPLLDICSFRVSSSSLIRTSSFRSSSRCFSKASKRPNQFLCSSFRAPIILSKFPYAMKLKNKYEKSRRTVSFSRGAPRGQLSILFVFSWKIYFRFVKIICRLSFSFVFSSAILFLTRGK